MSCLKICFRHSEESWIVTTLHPFLELQKVPREARSRLYHNSLVWWTYPTPLTVRSSLLHSLRLGIREGRPAEVGVCSKSLHQGSQNRLPPYTLVSSFCLFVQGSKVVSVYTWKFLFTIERELEVNFLSRPYCFRQSQLWGRDGGWGMLWFQKHECYEKLCSTLSFSLWMIS